MIKKQSKEINKIPLFASDGKALDFLELDKEVFNGRVNKDLLYQASVMYRANMRQGSASTKTRGNVRGGGKKPWRQKGTGRARVASIRNPIWRGGGVVFGPHPRDFRYSLPKKMKRSAFLSSLNAKLKDGSVSALSEIALPAPKTKVVCELLNRLKIKEKVLLLVKNADRNLILATRNVRNLTLRNAHEATALDVLSNKRVVMTKEAALSLTEKVKK